MRRQRGVARDRAADKLLLRVRDVVDSNDRAGALTLLLELLTRGGGGAETLPEVAANALVATARTDRERDDADRAALAAYQGSALVREEVVALIREAPLATDDLMAIQQAVAERLVQDRVAGRAAAPRVLEAARRETDLAFAGRAGGELAAKLGRGYLEVKYIPDR